MDFIDLDDTTTNYSNKEINLAINYVLKNELEQIKKWLLISHYIRYISDEKLLNNTIILFKKIPFLEKTFIQLNKLDAFIESKGIQYVADTTKIKATIYSLSFFCGISIEPYSEIIKNYDIPELRFDIIGRKINHNLSEITELLKTKLIGFSRDLILDLPTINEQSNEMKKIIQSLEIIDFDNSTKYFYEEIKHLESIKKNLTQSFTPKDTIKHENIFCNNGFVLFNYILNEYVKPINIKGRQSDLIFYHRKMYENKPQYIHQKPTEFFNWFENNYDEVFGQLKTLSQVETTQRNKDFSNALNWFKQQHQQVQ